MRILIVEDTEYLADALAHVLKRDHHQVDIATDGQAGLEYARSGIYDVIVLDNMLPKITGVKVSHLLRQEKNMTPIIMLSAKNEVDDKVTGLEAGADDYLGKPFKTSELLARIYALHRRSRHGDDSSQISIGNLTFKSDQATISTDKGSETLTAKESLLLEMLISHADKIVSKPALFRRAWGQDLFSEEKYVEVYISYLRKKLRSVNANIVIKTSRGFGYTLKVEEDFYV